MQTAARTALEPIVTDALRARGQRSTPQRLAVARALDVLNTHVTAEQIHGEVVKTVPGVSLPTVYSVLELFEQLDFVRRVPTQGGTTVFDPRTDAHQHLICRDCGQIIDVSASVDEAAVRRAARALGFEADQAEVVLRGRCAECAAAA